MSDADPSWALHETFLAVMHGGSLSAAARSLGVAQPTVRRRIEALEDALGAVLFTRSQNGLLPTAASAAMLPHAETMAATARALARSVSGPTDAERGTVRLSTSHVVGLEVLPPMLRSLRQAKPRIQVELALSNTNADLLRRDADVAVRMAAPTQAALVARRVGDVPLGLFASESYVATEGTPMTLSDLTEHALVGADRNRAFLEGQAAGGLPTRPSQYTLRTDHDEVHLAAIRAGVGIGVCQVPLALRAPKLVRVLPEVAFSLSVWVVMHEDLRGVRRVRAVFDHLVVELGRYLSIQP